MSKRYSGFFLSERKGNNEFSYDERKIKKIYVPKLISGGLEDLKQGKEVCFCEVEDGEEKPSYGLEYFVEMNLNGKRIYVFDNHNHAFYFWAKALKEGLINRGETLVHVDQHKDMREPSSIDVDIEDLDDVFEYTNKELNVGNFIVPALKNNLIKDVIIVDSSYSLSYKLPKEFILDIDLDFFSKEMDYIDYELKISKLRAMVKRAKIITFSTSPFFIEQDLALNALRDILKGE